MNKIFKLICLFLILSITKCQLDPVYMGYTNTWFGMNHKQDTNSLSFKFKLSEEDNDITLFRENAFILTFPALASSITPTCTIMNGDTNVVGITTDVTRIGDNQVLCVASGVDIKGVKLNNYVTITLSALKLNTNMYNMVKISLETGKTNGVLIAQNPAFNSYAQYNDYTTGNNVYVKSTSASISNSAPPSYCTSPCSTLYPFNDFSLTIDVQVTQHVLIQEFWFIIKLDGNGLPADAAPSISSSAADSTGSPFSAKLASSASDGALSLENLGMGYYAIKDIAPMLALTTEASTYNFVPNRKFKLTLSGFSTKNIQYNQSALSGLKLMLKWKNTNSILSYSAHDSSVSSISKISYLKITTGHETLTDIKSSVELFEAGDMKDPGSSAQYNTIYESGAWHLKFMIKVPKFNWAGKLKIISDATDATVFRFLASTCDFSEDSADANAFGERKVCVPSMGTELKLDVDATRSANDSAFWLWLPSSTSDQTVILTVWGFAAVCSKRTSWVDSGVDTTADFYKLKFNYEFYSKDPAVTTNDTYYKYAVGNGSTDSFESNIMCYGNVVPSSKYWAGTTTQLSEPAANIVEDKVIGTTLTYNDYLVYTEIYDWSFLSGVTLSGTSQIATNNAATSNMKYLSEITTSTDVSIFTQIDSMTSSFPLPHTTTVTRIADGDAGNAAADTDDTYDFTRTQTLLKGKLRLYIPSSIAEKNGSLTDNKCHLSWFGDSNDGTKTYGDIFNDNFTETYKGIASNVNFVVATEEGNSDQDMETGVAGTQLQPKILNEADNNKDDIGFYTNCYKIRPYTDSNIKIKSLYQSVSFYYKFERTSGDSSVQKVNRVARFFKFWNSLDGFRLNNVPSTQLTDTAVNFFYGNNDPAGTTTDNRLCIIEVTKSVFDAMEAGNDTLYMILSHTKLPKIGDYGKTDEYPVSLLTSGVKAYPLYSDEGYSGSNGDINNGFSNVTNTDFGSLDKYTPYLGSMIAFTGISNNNVTTDRFGGSMYVPIFCPPQDGDQKIIFQSVKLDGETINKTNNRIITITNSRTTTFKDLRGAPIGDQGTSMVSDVELRFRNFRTASDNANVNDLFVQDNSSVSNFYSIMLLSNDLVLTAGSIEDVNGAETKFFGQQSIRGNALPTKINGMMYNYQFFNQITGAKIGFSNSSKVELYNQPVFGSTADNRALKIHGVGAVTAGDGTNNDQYYFTNDGIFMEEYSGSTSPTVPNGDPELKITTLTPHNNKANYINDNAANFNIVAEVYSNLDLPGTLKISSSAIKNGKTLCVHTSDQTKTCVVSASLATCSGLEVKKDSYTSFSLTCFNMVTAANGKVTINSTTTEFNATGSYASYLTAKLVTSVSSETESTTAINAANEVVPEVAKVEFAQSRSKGGLSCAFFNVNLGRSYRIGQTVVITANINDMYVTEDGGSRRPNCRFALTSSFANLDEFNFFDNISNAHFIDSCVFSQGNGNSHTITIKTSHYVPNSLGEYSTNAVIQLCPVYAQNMNTINYSIASYLLEDAALSGKISSAPITDTENIKSFPVLSPSLPTADYTVTPAGGLCNLTSIFPRIAGEISEYNFKFVISEANKTFLDDTVNANSGSKCFNEFSIYMDPRVYNRNEEIWCMVGNNYQPTEWTNLGFINIRSNSCMSNGDYVVKCVGITNPKWTFTTTQVDNGGTEESRFNCSVNYFADDSRESLLTGTGNHGISTYITPTGNFVYYSPSAMVSNTHPNETGSYELLFTWDFTQGLTTALTSITTNGGNAWMFVKFPYGEYDFFNYSGNPTATLTYFKTATTEVTDADSNAYERLAYTEVTDAFTDITVSRTNNWIKILFTGSTTEFDADLKYFKLKLDGLPTGMGEMNSSQIQVMLIDDDLNPTVFINSFNNLSTNIGNPTDDNKFNSYYHGPSFKYGNNTKGYITFDKSFQLKPGRYTPVTFAITGSQANVSTEISMDSVSGFGTMEDKAKLDTGLHQSAMLHIGTACNTLYGSYWIGFSLSNTDNIYKIGKTRAIVTPLKRNVGMIQVVATDNLTKHVTSFSMPKNSMKTAYFMLDAYPYEEVAFTYGKPEGQTNHSTFAQSAGSDQKIVAKMNHGQFKYQIGDVTLEAPDNLQKITITSGNKCFGFGSSQTASVTISYTIEGELATLSGDYTDTSFQYVPLADSDSKNSMKIKFIAPTPETKCYFGVFCSNADLLTVDQVTSMEASMLNEKTSLVNIMSQVFTTNDDYTVNFMNLQRGTNYKFMAWCKNFGVTAAWKNLDGAQTGLTSSTQSNVTVTLKTEDLSTTQFVQYKFTQVQPAATIDRLLFQCQKDLDSTFGIGVAICSLGDGATLQGYMASNLKDCSSDSATEYFESADESSDTTEDDEETATEQNTTLRYLQDATTTNTTTNTTTTPTVVYNQTLWTVIKQIPQSTQTIDLVTFRQSLVDKVNTKTKLQEFLGNSITITGDMVVSNVVDQPLDKDFFSLNDVQFNDETGAVSFIAEYNRTLTCDWKLEFNGESSEDPELDKDDIMTCNNNSTTAQTCGKVTFKPSNTERTQVNLGSSLQAGFYFIQIACKSDIPESDNYVVFNSQALQVQEPEPTDTETSDPTCATGQTFNATSGNCETNVEPAAAKYINLYSMILMFVAFLLFDF